jgi:hypothetical protein
MPTSFSGENIIFKYLDSNIFALATTNTAQNGEEDFMVYLINGVSGKVVYKFFEKKIRLDQSLDFVLTENLFVMSFFR